MTTGTRARVTAVVLTFNEELNLQACLESLHGWVSGIVVVDSGSTDATMHIARQYGAVILQHAFETHNAQWRWALENLPDRSSEWIFGLDADQRVTPELAAEISSVMSSEAAIRNVDGFYVKRRQIFRGQWIRYGGYYPKYLLKLFRPDRVTFDALDLVDHHFYVNGRTRLLQHDLIEANLKEDDLAFWIAKHCRYAELMATEEHRRSDDTTRQGAGGRPSLTGTPDQRSLWRKRLWARLPLFVRPWLYFGYRYVLRLGFLDGRQGLVFHFLQACWFRFMVDVYRDQLQRQERR
jgi:glycosyltransferase involved in cell wall biosynthesis